MNATAASYRKTRQGEWVVMAPVEAFQPGRLVAVVTKSGETRHEVIARVGRPFSVGGVEMAYGYIDPRSAAGHDRTKRSCESCGSTTGVHHATDMSGIGGYACRRCDDGTLSFA